MLTIVSKTGGCDDGHCHHNKSTSTPNVLHEELFNHDVPQALGQDQIHLLSKSLVALLELQHLYLHHEKKMVGMCQNVQKFTASLKQSSIAKLTFKIGVVVIKLLLWG